MFFVFYIIADIHNHKTIRGGSGRTQMEETIRSGREEIENKNGIKQEREDIFRRILAEAMRRQASVIERRLKTQYKIINSPPTCLCENKCPPEGLSERGACKRYCMGTRYLQWLQRRGRPHVKVRAMLSKNSQALLDIHMPVDLGTCKRTPTCKTCKRLRWCVDKWVGSMLA